VLSLQKKDEEGGESAVRLKISSRREGGKKRDLRVVVSTGSGVSVLKEVGGVALVGREGEAKVRTRKRTEVDASRKSKSHPPVFSDPEEGAAVVAAGASAVVVVGAASVVQAAAV